LLPSANAPHGPQLAKADAHPLRNMSEHFIVEVTFDHRCGYVAALSTPAATSIQNNSGLAQGPAGASAPA
jgi:hypothetical protein